MRAVAAATARSETAQLDAKWRTVWAIVNQPTADRVLAGVDLDGANLQGGLLQGADLRDANLAHADLSGVDLTGAQLAGAYLRQTIVNEATQLPPKWQLVWRLMNETRVEQSLSAADLAYANLAGVFLRRADLQGADRPGATLTNVDLNLVDWRGTVAWPQTGVVGCERPRGGTGVHTLTFPVLNLGHGGT